MRQAVRPVSNGNLRASSLGREGLYVPFAYSKHVVARRRFGCPYGFKGARRAAKGNNNNDNYHGDKAILRSGGESLSKLG